MFVNAAGAPAGAGAPKMSRAFLEDLHSSVEEYLDVWQDYQQPPDLAAAGGGDGHIPSSSTASLVPLG